MNVYLAAPFSMKDQLAEYAKELQAAGINVTSRWLQEAHASTIQMKDLTPVDHEFFGRQDIEDVAVADVMVSFNDPARHFRQGRTAEFGMAIMINHLVRHMPILVVGEEPEHIFHYQKNVTHFPNWENTKHSLILLQQAYQELIDNNR